MRGLLIAVSTAAALGGLTGCGQAADSGAGPAQDPTVTEPTTTEPSVIAPADPTEAPATPTPPVSLAPDGPVVPPGVTQVPSAQVDATGVSELNEYRGLVWLYDDGRSLQMVAMATSGCGGVEARITGQTPTEVRIELGPQAQPQGGDPDGQMCTSVLTPRPVAVTLDGPLGDRTVHLSE
ncbi:hypothetical protein [Actinophytocola sediminis]